MGTEVFLLDTTPPNVHPFILEPQSPHLTELTPNKSDTETS